MYGIPNCDTQDCGRQEEASVVHTEGSCYIHERFFSCCHQCVGAVGEFFTAVPGDGVLNFLQEFVGVIFIEPGGGVVFALAGDDDVLVMFMEIDCATMLPHIVLIKAPHFIVNSHEPKSPVVFLCHEIIKLLRQALVAEAVIAEEKVLCV